MTEIDIVSKLLESFPETITIKTISNLWSREILRRNLGNRTTSAVKLGVSYRTLLRYISGIKKLGLTVHYPGIVGRRKKIQAEDEG
jgi:transcriptional regulator with AAA-type ATPase domain